VSRNWRLTRRAEQSLVDIALWTFETFGPAQADAYEAELIERCQAIADGRVVTQGCAVLAEGMSDETLRFARAGEHFVVFLDDGDEVVVLDFLHGRSDLARRVREVEGDRRMSPEQ
jgi:toxin ParE1/3/4